MGSSNIRIKNSGICTSNSTLAKLIILIDCGVELIIIITIVTSLALTYSIIISTISYAIVRKRGKGRTDRMSNCTNIIAATATIQPRFWPEKKLLIEFEVPLEMCVVFCKSALLLPVLDNEPTLAAPIRALASAKFLQAVNPIVQSLFF